MNLRVNKWFRGLLLGSLYTIGVLGILASGGSSGSRSTADFTCGLSIRGIAPVGDGTVWVGVFAKTNVSTEDRVVLLGNDGAEQLSYFIADGGSENAVRVVAMAGGISDDVYVGGDFPGGILRLNNDGSVDAGFDVGTGFNGRVTSIVPVNTGEVYVGGFFDDYDGTAVTGFVRLLGNGDLDTFGGIIIVGAPVDDVESVAMSGTLVTDDVYSGNGISPLIKRWNGNGLEVGGYNDPMLGAGSVLSITQASALNPGDIYLGGSFGNRIVRLESLGLTDGVFAVGIGFDADVVSTALATALLPATEAIYVGGSFTTYQGVSANGLVRLNDDGSRDTLGFDVGTGFSDPNGIFPFSKVASVAEDAFTTDVFVGGGFTQYNGNAVNGIARLDIDAGLDPAFNVSIVVDGQACDSQTIPDS